MAVGDTSYANWESLLQSTPLTRRKRRKLLAIGGVQQALPSTANALVSMPMRQPPSSEYPPFLFTNGKVERLDLVRRSL